MTPKRPGLLGCGGLFPRAFSLTQRQDHGARHRLSDETARCADRSLPRIGEDASASKPVGDIVRTRTAGFVQPTESVRALRVPGTGVVRAQGLTVEQPRGGRVGLVSTKPSRRSTGRVSVASSRSLIKVSTKALVVHSKRSRRSRTSVLGRWSRAERTPRVTSEFGTPCAVGVPRS